MNEREIQEEIKRSIKDHLKVEAKYDSDGDLKIVVLWDDEKIDQDYACNLERII
jgi:hypothetical protein